MSEPTKKKKTHIELYGARDTNHVKTGPLLGMTILDFTQNQAGPQAASLMCDYGARVIKVEPPGLGDPIRAVRNSRGFSAQLFTFNRGKLSIQIDLKTKEGLEIIYDLVKHCDAVLENFKVGIMDKLGVGYEKLKSINPNIIYCSASGFGLTGEWSKRGSYDSIGQAFSGAATSQGGGPSYKPIRVGTGNTCDTMSGIMAALSLLAALLQRERTGVAQRVDSSQLGAFMTLTNLTISQYLESGKQLDDGIMSGHHWNSYLDDYLSKDRKWFAIGSSTDQQWRRICKALGRLDMSEKFLSHRTRMKNQDLIQNELGNEFAKYTRDELIEMMVDVDVPIAPHNSYDDLLNEQHVWDNNLVVDSFGKRHVAPSANFSETKSQVQGPPPEVGEDTKTILADVLGYDNSKINHLLEKKVVTHNDPTVIKGNVEGGISKL